jgi:AmmeMemoRadiSam system protein B
MMRQPVVANQFYPGDPAQLEQTVAGLTPVVDENKKIAATAVIMPHAGYVYSGATAGLTISRVQVPETVIILGPNHHGRGAAVALGTVAWQMPMGTVPIDQELATQLLQISQIITQDEQAHSSEHSLEVQVPFLQFMQNNLHIVPLCVSHIPYAECEEVAKDIAKAVQAVSRPVLLVASTDMTHYKSREQASAQDHLAIENMLAFDPKGLYETVHARQISMCGVVPTVITLLASRELKSEKVELVRYTDSGEASGDTHQVVGYAGLIVS